MQNGPVDNGWVIPAVPPKDLFSDREFKSKVADGHSIGRSDSLPMYVNLKARVRWIGTSIWDGCA